MNRSVFLGSFYLLVDHGPSTFHNFWVQFCNGYPIFGNPIDPPPVLAIKRYNISVMLPTYCGTKYCAMLSLIQLLSVIVKLDK